MKKLYYTVFMFCLGFLLLMKQSSTEYFEVKSNSSSNFIKKMDLVNLKYHLNPIMSELTILHPEPVLQT